MTTTTKAPAILAAILAAQKAIGAVGKGDRNSQAGYNFRGVDAVVNAASPAFIEHGIVVTADVLEHEYQQVEVGKNRTLMERVTVLVRYTLTSTEDGSSVSTTALGAAGDSGDKATPKAMSVALRTALLQALMLPTDQPDPDSFTYGQDDHRQALAPEPPSADLVAAIVRLVPNGIKDPGAWVKSKAQAEGLDPFSGADMARLFAMLQPADGAPALPEGAQE